MNKLVHSETGDFYTQTSVTYDTPGDAKLNTAPLRLTTCTNRIKHRWTKINSITETATKINSKRW